MLECQNCGAQGDSFFSENYFGEMVCELCGTQSFLQARNETQDAEDMGMDFATAVQSLKKRVKKTQRDAQGNIVETDGRKRRRKKARPSNGEKQQPKLPPLVDCVVATQMVLDAMAHALVEKVGADTFPAEAFPKAVKQLWIKFLQTWGVKGTMPLLRCYNEFFLWYTPEEEEKLYPAVTVDLLEQWDTEWEKKKEQEEGVSQEDGGEETTTDEKQLEEETKPRRRHKERPRLPDARKFDTLSKFSIVDLLGILMLASRVLNLGLLPSDFADWVATGVIPYHNSLATCCAHAPDVLDSVKYVAHFFHSLMKRHKATAVQIAYSAHHLQYHMGLRLPPLNAPLAVHRLCGAMGLPGEVSRNFQWIAGFMTADGDQPEPPLLLQAETNGYPRFPLKPTKKDRARVDALLQSEVGIVAHLVVAIKMCANWHEWIFDRHHRDDDERRKAPPVEAINKPHRLPRRDLDAFAKFARQAFVDPERFRVPERLHEHLEQLDHIGASGELETPRSDARLKQNALYAYPAIHVNGVLAESDEEIEERMKRLRAQQEPGVAPSADGKKELDAFFYPVYRAGVRSALHPAYENVLELLCRRINAPIASVLPLLAELDKRMQSLIYHFQRTEYYVKLLEKGNEQWQATLNGGRVAPRPQVIRVSRPTKPQAHESEQEDE